MNGCIFMIDRNYLDWTRFQLTLFLSPFNHFNAVGIGLKIVRKICISTIGSFL